MGELVLWVQWLGMAVTMLGLVVVAPADLGALGAQVLGRSVDLVHKARGWLAERLPFLQGPDKARHKVRVYGLHLQAHDPRVRGQFVPTGEGSTAEQLDELRAGLASIRAELGGVQEAHETVRVALMQRLHILAERVQVLEQQARQDEENRRKLNGKGIPLAAGGALVAGWPGQWLITETAALNVGGWLLLAIGLALLVVGVVWVAQARDAVVQGWHQL